MLCSVQLKNTCFKIFLVPEISIVSEKDGFEFFLKDHLKILPNIAVGNENCNAFF